ELVVFFSSRRRHTRFSRDWSSDVCSSDLWGTTTELNLWRPQNDPLGRTLRRTTRRPPLALLRHPRRPPPPPLGRAGFDRPCRHRSEERRVGKQSRSWRWAWHE